MLGPGQAEEHHPAVLRLQTVGDVLLNLLTAPQEPAAIPSKLLPRAPSVLLLSTDEDLVHMVTETYLKVRSESTSESGGQQNLKRACKNISVLQNSGLASSSTQNSVMSSRDAIRGTYVLS